MTGGQRAEKDNSGDRGRVSSLLSAGTPDYSPTMSAHHRRSVCLIGLAVVGMAGCTPPPIDWTGTRSVQAPSANVALSSTGAAIEDSMSVLAARLTLPLPACAGSVRAARAGHALFAVWWSPRADSSARLVSAKTNDDGATWSIAQVDTTDRSVGGCHRSSPAIAVDASSGYVHVTYAMLAQEGPGIFFAHSMDGGMTFHSPVPLVYGERLGATSVAASGDRVVVAFEDPNSQSSRIGLALSRTMGHIFENRVLPVSDDNGSATVPIVTLHGARISVAWQERSGRGLVLHVRDGIIH